MRTFIKLLKLIILSISFSAYADELYNVELIMFLHKNAPLPSELVDNHGDLHKNKAAFKLVTDGRNLSVYNQRNTASVGAKHLSEIAKQLNNDNYLTLMHISWNTTINPGSNLYINLEKKASQVLSKYDPDKSNFQFNEIMGNIHINRSKYLHVDYNLAFNLPIVSTYDSQSIVSQKDLKEMNVNAPTKTFYIKNQRRKIASDEIHYIDHPLVGTIIKFTRLNS